MKKVSIFIVIILGIFLLSTSNKVKAGIFTKYGNYIYYHCADWGPDGKIYFIKQIIFMKNKSRRGNVVYFCSMNADGSEKKEITKLFENTKSYISLNGNRTFMDICSETKEVVITFSEADTKETGIWLINLDGTNFRKIVEQQWTKDFQPFFNHPSWFPDGSAFVCEEGWNHTPEISYYIVKFSRDGKDKIFLTSNDEDGHRNKFPTISPDGKKISYTHCNVNIPRGGRDLWLMDISGSNKRMLYDENGGHYADYSEWSPDGKQIYVKTPVLVLIDSKTGEENYKKNIGTSKVSWGPGDQFLINGGGMIAIVPKESEELLKLGVVSKIETKNKEDLSVFSYRWGDVSKSST